MFFKGTLGMDVKAIIGANNLNSFGAVNDRKDVLERAFEAGKEIVKG
ncbi:MAG: hypothetical protein ACPLRZ_08420 [Thermovenabulum sp.]